MVLRKAKFFLLSLLIFFSSIFIFSCIPPMPHKLVNEEPLVRVLIDRIDPGVVEVKVSDGGIMLGGNVLWKSVVGKVRIRVQGEELVVNDCLTETNVVDIYPNFTLNYKNIDYWGMFRIVLTNGYVYIINILPLEKYLECVVPSEMPAAWSMEALKAQAITSRTYALYLIKNSKNELFDLYSSYRSQVYRGLKNLNPRSTKAVIETKGIVIVYRDEIIQAFFHANSGGFIEDSSLLVNKNLPYLKASVDSFSKENYRSKWSLTMGVEEFCQIVFGVDGVKLKTINIPYRLPSGSVKEINIVGVSKEGLEISRTLTVDQLRDLIPSILSPKFSVEVKGSKINFRGYGWGHGVGLSQWGSKEMAQQGYNYREIIKFYFKDTEITKVY